MPNLQEMASEDKKKVGGGGEEGANRQTPFGVVTDKGSDVIPPFVSEGDSRREAELLFEEQRRGGALARTPSVWLVL